MDTRTLPAQTLINGVSFNATPGQRPVLVDGTTTIVGLFQKRCAEMGSRTAHREKDFGIWKTYSWADYWQHAKWIGLALRKRLAAAERVIPTQNVQIRGIPFADDVVTVLTVHFFQRVRNAMACGEDDVGRDECTCADRNRVLADLVVDHDDRIVGAARVGRAVDDWVEALVDRLRCWIRAPLSL